MRLIDRTAHGNRWRHRHPVEKLAPALGLIVVTAVLPPMVTAPPVLAATTLAAIAGAGVPAATWLRVLSIPAAFLALGLPGLLVSIETTPHLAFAWAPGGLALAVDVGLRALAAAACLAFLVLTTPVADLVHGLRRLGVPKPFVEVMLLTYRLIFVLLDTAAQGMRAEAARLGFAGGRQRCRSAALLAGGLLQTALGRARRLEAGLAARGYRGDLPVLADRRPPSAAVLAATLALVGAVAAVGLLAG
jgi:cobalt/nickel transport system permease protein